MFTVLRGGVHHSAHDSYASACRVARIQAETDHQTYYTVHRGDLSKPLYKAEAIRGVSSFIVQPMTPKDIGIERVNTVL